MATTLGLRSPRRDVRRALWAALSTVMMAAAFVFFPPHSADAQNLKKLKITIPVPAFGFYPVYVAADQGYFAKEGYEVEIISTSGDGPDVDAVISGSADFAVSTPNRLFTAYEQGKRLLAVMTTVNRMAIECIMNKAFMDRNGLKAETPLNDKLKAVKGHTIAGTRPGSFTYLTAVRYLKRVGLESQKDTKVIGVGGFSSMLAALENEQIVLACTASPTPELGEARGKSVQVTHNLAGEDPAYNDFLFQHVYATPEYTQKNPEVVRATLRALLAGINYIQHTPDKDQLPEMRKRFTGLSDDVLLAMLRNNKDSYKSDGFTTMESVKKAAGFLRDAGVLKSNITDWSPIVSNEFLPKK